MDLVRAILDGIPEDVDLQSVALALLGAGILLLADTDPETAEALLSVVSTAALRIRSVS